jgi:Flp pilus assembly protein TadG
MTPGSLRARLRGEEGAVLLQVGVGLLAFTAVSALVIDYGAQLVSHAQVQNTVDAAALAGATSLAFDDSFDLSAEGPAAAAALTFARQNAVWGQAPTPATVDIQFPACNARDEEDSDNTLLACIDVTAHRDKTAGNAVSALMGGLVDSESFGVAAFARAQARDANATDCLKPLAIPDRWLERMLPWSPASTFDLYNAIGQELDFAVRDVYVGPTQTGNGSGLTFSAYRGARITLTPGRLSYPIGAWQYLPVQIAGGRFPSNDVQANTSGCAASLVTLEHPDADTRLRFAAGDVAANETLIAAGAQQLVAKDPAAQWNPVTKRIDNSCAEDETQCASMSPRLVALAVYDPFELTTALHDGAAGDVRLRNIIGLFIESVDVPGQTITGYITRHPGLRDETAITLHDDSSFLRTARLVQ